MQKDFYERKLYPLQDKILEKINFPGNNLYLTGGTALSRFYLNHRYSEDLDFFVNDDPSFLNQIESVQKELSKFFELSVVRKEEKFARFFIDENDIKLKLEFINDVPFYLGKTKRFRLFGRVDNKLNILSNKITAVSDREEPKDFADILYIYKSMKVDWEVIFAASQSKAAGIFPPLIAKKIEEFEIEKLNILNWIITPDYNELKSLKEKLLKDLLGI